jgi:hypothetical protein
MQLEFTGDAFLSENAELLTLPFPEVILVMSHSICIIFVAAPQKFDTAATSTITGDTSTNLCDIRRRTWERLLEPTSATQMVPERK